MDTIILNSDQDGLNQAVLALKRGDLVALPTETVYGLGGIISSAETLTKIFSAKERPFFDPLIVHVRNDLDSLSQLGAQNLVDQKKLSEKASATIDLLIRAFWPGPLTLILPKHEGVHDLVTSGLPNVALRMPAHPLMQAVLKELDSPIAAPSANRFGRISPVCAQDVMQELQGRIPFILDGGPCAVGIESTVIAVDPETAAIKLFRPGGIALDAIKNACGTEIEITHTSAETSASSLSSPGTLASHYAPHKPVRLLANSLAANSAQEIKTIMQNLDANSTSLLSVERLASNFAEELIAKTGIKGLFHLSENGDSHEAAQNLFTILRRFDQSESTLLIVEPCLRQDQLWPAIADRLQRASFHNCKD